MTRHVYRTCIHCNADYVFQSSGFGCNREGNSSEYCETCALAIRAALKQIPPAADYVFIDVTDEAEKTAVLAAREEKRKNPDTIMGIAIREIGGSLFRFEGTKVVASMHTDVITYNGVRYSIGEWNDGKTPMNITKRMLKDRKTGALRVPHQR